MEEIQKEYELIDDYLEGKLDWDAMVAFEDKMKKDEKLSGKVKIQLELVKSIRKVNEEKKLKDIFIELDGFIPEPHMHMAQKMYFITGGTLCLFFVLFGIYFLTHTKDNSHQAQVILLADAGFKNHFQPLGDSITAELSQNVNSNDNSILIAALQHYSGGQYKECAGLLQTLLKKHEDNPDLLFYSAMCMMKIENYALAKSYLELLLKIPQTKYSDVQDWYYALVLLKTGDFKESEKILNKIANSGGFNAPEAILLLKEIKVN
jgi:tetratricopeptide (TPR) repeat protein